jgi:hypothetical protein
MDVSRVERISQALRAVSDLNKNIYGMIEAWRNRPHPRVPQSFRNIEYQ